jgi:DNA (cytosine-5)-methyltransferase 1
LRKGGSHDAADERLRDKGGAVTTVGSLFSGIGGLDLGLERAGMKVIWQSEIDPYASRVLAKHWPDVPNLGNVKEIDWDAVERPDLICGGYPCQPFSLAGARRGTDDDRHLWPYFAESLRVLRPEWALLENVPGHLSLGFGDVQADLAELRYDTEWECIPAAAVGAPHLRWRIFVVAHSQGYPRRVVYRDSQDDVDADSEGEPGEPVDAFARSGVMVPDADCERHRGLQPVGLGGRGDWSWAAHDGPNGAVADAEGFSEREPADEALSFSGGRGTRAFIGGGGWWATEPDVGRVADGVPSRVDRLRCLGNAVVPQVAEFIGRQLMAQIGERVAGSATREGQ